MHVCQRLVYTWRSNRFWEFQSIFLSLTTLLVPNYVLALLCSAKKNQKQNIIKIILNQGCPKSSLWSTSRSQTPKCNVILFWSNWTVDQTSSYSVCLNHPSVFPSLLHIYFHTILYVTRPSRSPLSSVDSVIERVSLCFVCGKSTHAAESRWRR